MALNIKVEKTHADYTVRGHLNLMSGKISNHLLHPDNPDYFWICVHCRTGVLAGSGRGRSHRWGEGALLLPACG